MADVKGLPDFPLSVKDLDCFDPTNFQLASSEISYRRAEGWSDEVLRRSLTK